MPRTKLDRNFICMAADRELKHNPLDRSKRRILDELGIAPSSYYSARDTGTMRLETFARLARHACLTDEQILKVIHAGD